MKHDEIALVYQAHSREVYLYAMALCRNHHIAEDLTGDTFYKALLSLNTKTGGVKYWLLRVCKNLFVDMVRKQRGVPSAQDPTGGDPLSDLISGETRRDLYAKLLRLAQADRELLTMFYFLDCSVAQIAAHLGKTQGAVKTGLSRARVRLKKLLEEDGI